MDKHTVRFTAEKETKNTVRFQENTVEGQPAVIGSIYIPKWVVGNQTSVDVTIEPAADSASQPKQPKK